MHDVILLQSLQVGTNLWALLRGGDADEHCRCHAVCWRMKQLDLKSLGARQRADCSHLCQSGDLSDARSQVVQSPSNVMAADVDFRFLLDDMLIASRAPVVVPADPCDAVSCSQCHQCQLKVTAGMV